MNLFQSGRKTFEMDLQMNPMPAYSRLLGIDANKYKDLKKISDNGILPKAHHAFYKDLALCQKTIADDGSGSEYEDE